MGAANSTPDLLIDAAARLFAERGVDNVSIADIVRSADQRNASAVHYHFGSRDDILLAVLTRHVGELAQRRLALLKEAQARPAGEVRPAAEAIVRPITEFAQGGWRQRAYLQIGSDLAGAIDRVSPEIQEVSGPDGGRGGLGPLTAAVPQNPLRPVAGPP